MNNASWIFGVNQLDEEVVRTSHLKRCSSFSLRYLDRAESKKIKTLFKIKDEILHKANVIYRGTSVTNPEDFYIGETAQISTLRFNEHEDPKHDSAPSKYLKENEDHRFTFYVGNSDEFFIKLVKTEN